MNELTTFNFNNFPVRISTVNGEPNFHANDVCVILGYANPRQALDSHVEKDDVQKFDTIDNLGRKQLANYVNEAGLYALILGSEKTEAKPFKHWVTHDVLPSIRKTGGYVHPKAKNADSPLKIITDAARAFSAVQKMIKGIGCDENVAAISANQVIQKAVGINMLEMAGQTHLIAANQEELYLTPTALGKPYDLSGQAFNKILVANGLQERIGEEWVPTKRGQPYARIYDTGKRHGDGVLISQVKWLPSVVDALNLKEVENGTLQ